MKQISEMNIFDIFFELFFIKYYHKGECEISDIYKRAKELYQNENNNSISDEEVEKWIHNKCCYGVLDELLYNMIRKLNKSEIYEDQFMYYNFPVIMDMMKEFLEDCEIDNNYNIKDLTNLTNEEIDKYICNILKEIDPSLEWLNIYIKAKNEGKILDISNYSKDELEQLKIDLKLDKIPSGNNCIVVDNENYCLILTLNNTLYDIINTIHELIHFIITDNDINLPPILSEFFSIFYELYAVSYLYKKGFDINELYTIYQKLRIADLSLISLTFKPLYIYLEILAKNGRISLNDDIKYYENMLGALKKIDKLPSKYEQMQPIDLAFKKCDKYIKFLLDNEFYDLYPYVVGSYLTFEAMKNCDKNLLIKIRNFINPTSIIDPYEVFSVCGCIEDDLERVGEEQIPKEKRH